MANYPTTGTWRKEVQFTVSRTGEAVKLPASKVPREMIDDLPTTDLSLP